MAYATTDLFVLYAGALGGDGPRFFYHESADALAAVNTTGFITDGDDKGLRAGDFVDHLDTTSATGDLSRHRVVSVNASTGAVDLTDGTVICAGANAD